MHNIVFTDDEGFVANIEVADTEALAAVQTACAKIRNTPDGQKLSKIVSIEIEEE